MAIVGVAYPPDKRNSYGRPMRTYIIINSWGQDQDHYGQGVWQLAEDALDVFEGRRINVCGFNKFLPGYEKHQQAWDCMNEANRDAWRDGLLRIHNNMIDHIPGAKKFQA